MSYILYIQYVEYTRRISMSGYVRNWEAGYLPEVIDSNKDIFLSVVMRFPSKKAALSYGFRMKNHYGNCLKYFEVCQLTQDIFGNVNIC